jgi:hypothetical protein
MAMSAAVVQKQNEEVVPIDLTSPSGGKSAVDYTQPSIRWLELIDERDNPVELEEMLHARVNSVFPIIYCTNNKDVLADSNWAPCILRKVCKEQYKVLDWQRTRLTKTLIGKGTIVFWLRGVCIINIPPWNL